MNATPAYLHAGSPTRAVGHNTAPATAVALAPDSGGGAASGTTAIASPPSPSLSSPHHGIQSNTAGGGGAASPSLPSNAPANAATAAASSEPHGSLSAVALEAIEQRYVEVLRALTAEPQLEPFRTEYEKLHRLLLSSHDGEQRLLRQAQELREELDTHQQKIQTAMQLSQEDEEAIRVLRGAIEAAWAKADQAHEQEQRSRELVNTLRQQVTELDHLVEKTAGLSVGQEAYLRDLLALRKEREDEAILTRATLHRTEAEHKQATAQMREADAALESATAELEAQRKSFQQLLTNLEAEQRERAAKEASVRQYRASTEQCARQLEEHNTQVDSVMRDEKKSAKEAELLVQEVQALTRQVQEKQDKFTAEAARLAAAERENTLLSNEVPQRQALLREQQEELTQQQKRLTRSEKSARTQQQELASLVEERAAMAASVQERSAAVDAAVTALVHEEKEQKALEEEVRKAMHRKSQTVAANTQQADALAQIEGQRVMEAGKRRRLEQQVEQLRSQNEGMRKAIYYAEQHREKDTKAAQQAVLSYHRTLDAIRVRRSEAKAMEEDIALHQRKLKAQHDLLNTVTVDRHKAEKLLRETEEELRQLQQRHGGKQDELEGIKTDLVQQEAELCQLHGLARQVNKDVTHTEQRLRFLREDRQHAEGRVEALLTEAMQLRHVIASCDDEAQQQQARLTVMTRERNTLAAQLLSRSEELTLVREKLQLVDAGRAQGEHRYDHAMQQLLTARDALTEQRLRCRLSLVRLRYLERLRKKERGQETLLAQSRSQVRALADALGTKHNLHVWRSLEGKAPEILDGMAKVQLLRVKLLKKRDELHAKVAQVAAAEAEYVRLRQQLARLPGPEAAEELTLCAENMNQRRAQLLDMTKSLATAEGEAELLEGQVEQLQQQLQYSKQRYFQEKAKQDAWQQEERVRAQTCGVSRGNASSLSSRRHFAGTGRSTSSGTAAADANSGGGLLTLTGGSAPLNDSNAIPEEPRQTAVAAVGENGRFSSVAPVRASPHEATAPSRRGMPRSSTNEHPTSSAAHAATAGHASVTLTAGPPQPNFPLQKPPHQRQFVGGGFSLTR